jgi:hypothetical protein
MSFKCDVEIYKEDKFKEDYPNLYESLKEKVEENGGSISDFEFSQLNQFDLSNDTFFLSYVNKDNEGLSITLEGEVNDPKTYRFEIEHD